MAQRRLVASAELADLVPEFARIRKEAGVEEGFPHAAYFEAEGGGGEAEPRHVPGTRADRTDLELVTIDPVGSLDLDQALWVAPTGDGWLVHYAIADVAAHVIPGGPLDIATHARGETLYCPDTRIGLHPAVMSEGYASLLPGQRTKAALWTMRVDGDGAVADAVVERAWVRSRAKYSYQGLHADPPSEAVELLASLHAFGEARRALTRARGGVSLPKPSQEVVVDGGHVTLAFEVALPLEDDNAQVSLLAGEAAAAMMLAEGVGVLRTMPPAPAASVRRLRHQAHALGIAWPDGVGYGDLLPTLDPDAPATAAFLVQAITLFRSASWQAFGVAGDDGALLPIPEPATHGALAVPYAHVTAPLRRLVDRYGTEVCLAHSAGRETPDWVSEALPTLGAEMATAVHRSGRVDSACLEAVECAVLSGREGERFDAVAIEADEVQLASPAVEGRCQDRLTPGTEVKVTLVAAESGAGPVFALA